MSRCGPSTVGDGPSSERPFSGMFTRRCGRYDRTDRIAGAESSGAAFITSTRITMPTLDPRQNVPANPAQQTMLDMSELLRLMVEKGASDLHITLGAPPMLRVDGLVQPTNFPRLTAEICQHLIYSLLTDTQ